MKYFAIEWDDLKMQLQAALIMAKEGAGEIHASLQITNPCLSAEVQFRHIEMAMERISGEPQFQNAHLIWKRYFVSDAANQSDFIVDDARSLSSIVQQPPLNGVKVAVWLYYVTGDCIISREGHHLLVQRHKGITHRYTTQLHIPLKNEYAETEQLFNAYIKTLQQRQSSLRENCIRTWIYVQGVDIHYEGMVKARVAAFEREGLNKETHYIASTAIEGRHTNPNALVSMDAYAIEGIKQDQVTYLHAPTHLNRTHDYGVTFERGTAVDFADRRHVYISGTASINNKGEITHPGDVMKQLKRTWENIGMLLSEADCSAADLVQMIVYLRDIADYQLVKGYFDNHQTQIPKVIVLAPVCRPGWLIEIECMAIKKMEKRGLPDF